MFFQVKRATAALSVGNAAVAQGGSVYGSGISICHWCLMSSTDVPM